MTGKVRSYRSKIKCGLKAVLLWPMRLRQIGAWRLRRISFGHGSRAR
jgi:hypothetical protein